MLRRAAGAVALLQIICARAWRPTAPALPVRRTALMGAPGRGFGAAEKKTKTKKPPPAAAALDEPARRELALQALQFALDVMLQIQEPSAAFLASPGLAKLPATPSLARAGASSIDGAGSGLFAAADLPAGALVAFMPVHGIGMDNLLGDGASTLVVLDDADGAYFDSVAACPPYRQCLPGRPARGLFFLAPELDAPDRTPAWIDANPARPLTPGWAGSLVNDGARCDAPDEASVVAYYAASAARKNVALVPVGPAPLMAYVTTRAVREGDELLTTYGCEYWLAAVPGAAERLEVTPRVLAPVREAAACLQEHAALVAREYAADVAQLEKAFAELARQGAPAAR